MTAVETYTTDGQDPARKLEYWNEIACNTFTPIVADPVDLPSFAAGLTRGQIGGLLLAEVHSAPAVVRHTQPQVARTREAVYFLLLQLEGTSINRQDNRDTRLAPGDFTLCATIRPYEMNLPAPSSTHRRRYSRRTSATALCVPRQRRRRSDAWRPRHECAAIQLHKASVVVPGAHR